MYGANYTVAQPAGLKANITPASLAVSGISASDKVYDATTTATLTGTASVAALTGDTVSVTGTGSGTFADKNVGTAKVVTVSGYTLSGTDVANYTVAQPAGVKADITPASLAVSGISASDKVYDATTTATLTGTASVAALTGDTVSVSSSGSGTFADKNVGTSKAVSVSGFTLSGTDAANYTVAQPSGVKADITPASLAVSGIAASDKVYDATTAATLTGTANLTALGRDVVSVTGSGSAAFADKNVGTAKAVAVSGYTLSGTDAGNYSVVQPVGVTAKISARPLNVSYGGVNKDYDGTVAATVTTVDDRLAGDTLAISRRAAFIDPNVGVAKLVTVSGASLGGEAAGNYALASTSGTTNADITGAPIPPSPPVLPTPPDPPPAPPEPHPAPAIAGETNWLVSALSSLSRSPPETVKACGASGSAGLDGACGLQARPQNPFATLVIEGRGIRMPDDVMSSVR